jgi:hypothetical protein
MSLTAELCWCKPPLRYFERGCDWFKLKPASHESHSSFSCCKLRTPRITATVTKVTTDFTSDTATLPYVIRCWLAIFSLFSAARRHYAPSIGSQPRASARSESSARTIQYQSVHICALGGIPGQIWPRRRHSVHLYRTFSAERQSCPQSAGLSRLRSGICTRDPSVMAVIDFQETLWLDAGDAGLDSVRPRLTDFSMSATSCDA